MRRARVSSFFADVTQQIHSLRASGVISAQIAFATASDSIALRISAGILWTGRARSICFGMRGNSGSLANSLIGATTDSPLA